MNRVCEVAVIYVIAPNPYLFHGFLWVYHILFTPFLRLKLSCEFAEYSQQDAKFHNLLISVRRSTCFKRVFRPSSGAQNCTYSVRPILLRACSLASLAAGSSNGLTHT